MENTFENIIYLDNAATTKMDDRVVSLLSELNDHYYANPSSLHRMGFLAEKKQDEYLENFCKSLNVSKEEIIFTSGGTESNNLAIKGVLNSYKHTGRHIITSSIEHPSVLRVFKELELNGFEVKYLNVNSEGKININDLEDSIRNDTILVSIMHINNEIGSINDITKIGNIIKEKNPNTFFHTDMVQSFSKYFVNIKNAKIDLFSASAHKFYGPKGVGFLYKNNNLRLNPILLGGGQQNNLRSGTLNTFSNIMMMEAYSLMIKEKEVIKDKVLNIYNKFVEGINKLNNEFSNIYINSKNNDDFSKYILSVSFKGIRSEVLLHSLEEDNIFVSSGSACSSHHKTENNTLDSIGLNKDLVDSAIRFSFGKYNTINDVDKVMDALYKKINILRKYTR